MGFEIISVSFLLFFLLLLVAVLEREREKPRDFLGKVGRNFLELQEGRSELGFRLWISGSRGLIRGRRWRMDIRNANSLEF